MTHSSGADREPTIAELRSGLRSFVEERSWEGFHDPKNLAMALASEVGELVALLRWVNNTESDGAARSEPLRSRLAEEIGDVGILLLLLCDRLDVRLEGVIDRKLALNAKKYPADLSFGRPDPPALEPSPS